MSWLKRMQEEDVGLGERRRQSATGLRSAEQPLTPVMVSHVVDALFDRCGASSPSHDPPHLGYLFQILYLKVLCKP